MQNVHGHFYEIVHGHFFEVHGKKKNTDLYHRHIYFASAIERVEKYCPWTLKVPVNRQKSAR